MTIAGAGTRADHTATLLTDGRVLIVGGSGPDGALADAEIWDIARATAGRAPSTLAQPRRQHEAALLGDGRVRLRRGVGPDGAPVAADEWFDPSTGLFTPATGPDDDRGAPGWPRRCPSAARSTCRSTCASRCASLRRCRPRRSPSRP